jgi:hypothetical protein
MNDLILYTTDDGKSQIQLRADLGTVWLTQLKVAELFQITKQNIAKHLKAIFFEQELSQASVVNQRLTTEADGNKYRAVQHNLRVIWTFPILYALCRELPSPNRLGNCQRMLDSSGIKSLPVKWQESDRFATRCVANSSPLARQ